VILFASLSLASKGEASLPKRTSFSINFTAIATSWFTNNYQNEVVLSGYDSAGFLKSRAVTGNGTINRTQTLSWDGRGRLWKVVERDSSQSGFDQTMVYDPLGRRVRQTILTVTNGVSLTGQLKTIDHYFDPEREFLEVGAADNGRVTWKIHGPDLNGRYGGLNGIGGYEAYCPGPEFFCPFLFDSQGNLHGVYDQSHATISWFPSRVTGYGAVPGYLPPPFAAGAGLDSGRAWHNRGVEISGLIWMGARFYDPVAGRFISPDPFGHASSTELYSYVGGDPANRVDADGRIGKGMLLAGLAGPSSTWVSEAEAAEALRDALAVGADVLGRTAAGAASRAAATANGSLVALFILFGAQNAGSSDGQEFPPGQGPHLIEPQQQGAILGEGQWRDTDGNLRDSAGIIPDQRNSLSSANSASSPNGPSSGTGIWQLGPSPRGFAIEALFGANLPKGFPVIDRFENGLATSIKSIDLGAASYQDMGTLASKINGYVDSVANFNGARWAGQVVEGSEITSRQVQLAIPVGSASAAQQTAIDAATTRAQGLGVKLIVTPVP